MTQFFPRMSTLPGAARQRATQDETVLVLLSAVEAHVAQIRRGAQEASARRLPLQIAVLGIRDEGAARCMAAMDDAVMMARRIAPEVEIRVETEALEPDRMSLLGEGRHPVVVSSRRTRDLCAVHAGLQWVDESNLIVL
jgi:uncharacterized protein GlcG (DUF336 family)